MSLIKSVEGETVIIENNPQGKMEGFVVLSLLILIPICFVLFQMGIKLVEDFNFILFIFIIIFAYGIYTNYFNLLWNLIGKERIEFHSDLIRHEKIIWVIKKSTVYKRSLIGVPIVKLNENEAHIHLYYNRKSKTIGIRTNQEEAQIILEELKK